MAALKIGDPMDEATTLAPLSSEDAAETVLQQVQSCDRRRSNGGSGR